MLPGLDTPMLLVGAVDNLATDWEQVNGVAVTGGQADPFGGTGAYLVDDDQAGLAEHIQRTYTPSKRSPAESVWFLKADTAALTEISYYETVAGINRSQFRLTWSGGVPTPSWSAGTAGQYWLQAVGGSWYALWLGVKVAEVLSGNPYKWRLFPAGNNATATGRVLAYRRRFVVPGWVDQVVAWSEEAEGSEWRRVAGGSGDAWRTGLDRFLRLAVRWVPIRSSVTPVMATGWDGRDQAGGFDCGWERFLEHARDGETVRYVWDRTDAAQYRDAVLVGPRDPGPPDLEDTGDRRLVLTLADAQGSPTQGFDGF